MSDVTLLRKLTRKSILGFGKHKDLTVQNLIDLDKKSYLRWVYYNCSKIDFMEDILKEIFKQDFVRLNKPDKNPELYEAYLKKWMEKTEEDMPNFVIQKLKAKTEKKYLKDKKRELVNNRKRDKIFFSKGAMQSRNHGR